MRSKLAVLVFAAASSSLAQPRPVSLAGPWKVHTGSDLQWAQPGVDDSAWPTATLPKRMPLAEPKYWLRRTVTTPPASEDLTLALGLVSESYEVYVNGSKVGETGGYGSLDIPFFRPRSFTLPTSVLHSNACSVIALRIWNSGMAWGAFASGVQDHGPWLLTSPPHALAEVKAASAAIRLAVVPVVLVIFGSVGIGLCLLLLWLTEPERRELLLFSSFLFVTAASFLVGVWHLFYSSSSLWTRLGYRPLSSIAYALLFAATTRTMIVRPLPLYVPAAAGLMSLGLAALRVGGTGSYLYPWMILIVFQCIAALYRSYRKNVAIAVPLLLYILALANNMPRFNLFPSAVSAFGMGFSITNFIQLIVAAAILVILFRRLAADRVDKQRLASEFDAARTVQSMLLAGGSESTPGYTCATVYRPAQEVGGDFFRILPAGDGNTLLVVGDVSGKGLRAAMLVSAIVGALLNRRSDEPAEVLTELNRAMYGQTNGGFITSCAALFAPDGYVKIANAGHVSPFHNGTEVDLAGALPLGIIEHVPYQTAEIYLAPKDSLLFLSDGVIEAASPTGELFGFNRASVLASEAATELAAAAQAFGQNDDITVVTMTRIVLAA